MCGLESGSHPLGLLKGVAQLLQACFVTISCGGRVPGEFEKSGNETDGKKAKDQPEDHFGHQAVRPGKVVHCEEDDEE